MKSTTTYILWFVYICLLAVLLPHTAWAFESMEAPGTKVTHWIASIAFEAAIAVLTHKLAKHIETTSKMKGWRRFAARYLNPFAVGLFMATLVSFLANLAHAVEFGKPLAIFTQWGIPQSLYSVAFGGVLPLASLIFARVLSNVTDSEDAPNPEVEQAKQVSAALRKQVHDTETRAKAAEENVRAIEQEAKKWIDEANRRADLAEERFGAMGDLFKKLFSDDTRERILAVREWKPKLSGAAIALIADSSPSYVSEVLKEQAIDA